MKEAEHYIAIYEINGETYASTVSPCGGSLIEYAPSVECMMCSHEAGDEWINSDWMLDPQGQVKDVKFVGAKDLLITHVNN